MKFINKEIKFDLLLFLAIVTVTIFVYSSYAWFASTLDVKIYDFKVKVDSKSKLEISFDGKNWFESIDVDKKTILDDIEEIYSTNTNQWSKGLETVSTIGIRNTNDDKFYMFESLIKTYKVINYNNLDKIDIRRVNEEQKNVNAPFISFDIFIKNITPSPYGDDLKISSKSFFNDMEKPNIDNPSLNALRIGIIKIGEVSEDASISQIQNISCNNNCSQIIYDPYPSVHSTESIEELAKHGVELLPDTVYPTYAVKSEGDKVEFWRGIYGSNLEFEPRYFEYQNTFIDTSKKIFTIQPGITKYRIYIWIEGQDIDIAEYFSQGSRLSMALVFEKEYGDY